MTIDRYLRLISTRRRLIAAVAVLGALSAGLLWFVDRPDYEATTELFVTTGDIPRALEQAYEGERYAADRMRSYSRILAGPVGAEAVRRELALTESPESIASRISVGVPPNSVLAEVTVTDPSAERAQAIANALGARAQQLIDRLEAPVGTSPLVATVTRPAELPGSPAVPLSIYLLLGGLLGFVAGIAAALVRDRMDERLIIGSDASAAARAPVLGRIPQSSGQRRSPVIDRDPASAQAESYRALRANLLAVAEEHERRVIAITSAVAEEGGTEVTANLGLAFVQTGATVALVDANLHSPRLDRLLGLESEFGLVDILTGRLSLDLALNGSPARGLQLLSGGRPGRDATELLEGEGFGAVLKELADRFDWVMVDSPPILAATDGLVATRQAGAALLVAQAGSTDSGQLREAARALDVVEAELLGVILNRVPARSASATAYGYGATQRASRAAPATGQRRPR